MSFRTVIILIAAACLSLVAAEPDSATRTRSLISYGKLPLQFEANRGQADSRVKFLARGGGYTLLLTADEARLSDATANIEMKLIGSDGRAAVQGMNSLPGKVNYIAGKDPANWRIGIPTFGKVRYRQVYPGIDVVYYGNRSQLEYDFILAPGADPSSIRLGFSGTKPHLSPQGDVVLTVGTEQIGLRKPVVYQMDGSAKQMIPGSFVLAGSGEVRFKVDRYDRSRTLVIDPVLVYTSYLGGTQTNAINGLAVNAGGQLYVTGSTSAVNFPTTPGSYAPTSTVATGPQPDAFVSKISADGTTLLYSTYLSGSNADVGVGIAVDANDNAYVTGYTTSNDFPVTPDAMQSKCGPQGVPANEFFNLFNTTQASCSGQIPDVFLAKLDPTGTQLLYSTFLGGDGNDQPSNIALDAQGNVYVAGFTNSISTNVQPSGSDVDFPVTASAFQSSNGPTNPNGSFWSFITKLSPDLHTLLYSSIIGSASDNTFNQGMAVGQNGIVFIGGRTLAQGFPVKNAFQSSCEVNGTACYTSGYISEFDTTASGDASLVFSTYLNDGLGMAVGPSAGFTETQVHALAADAQNNVYAVGETSELNFPTTPGAFSPACPYNSSNGLCNDPIVLKFSPAGSLLWSTYFGSNNSCCNAVGLAIALDSNNNVYAAGTSASVSGLPLRNAFQSGPAKPGDQVTAFVWTLSSDGSQLLFSSYFGGGGNDTPTGMALDRAGNIYLAGYTTSPDLPVTSGAVQTVDPGFQQGFFAKVSCLSAPCPALPSLPVNSISLVVSPASATLGQLVTMTATVTGQPNQPTPTGSVTFYNGATPLGQMSLSGTGTATFTSTTLAAGSYAVTATYAGDDLYFGNTSAAQSLTVSAAATTTTANSVGLTFSPNAQQIALNATVTSTSGTVNSGSVNFTLLGATVPGAVSNGLASASFTVPGGTAAGSYAITAAYIPSGNFGSSSDNTMQLSIAKATPVITWANPAGIQAGTALASTQLNAAASVPGSFVYSPPAGTVLAVGGQTLSATFTPTDSTDYNTAMVSVPINVGNAAPTATNTVTNNVAVTYSQSQQQITLSATVTSTSGVVNSGSVKFSVNVPLVGPVSAPVQNGSASATLTLPAYPLAPAAGNYAITAAYLPSGNFAASSDATKQLIISNATFPITWANPAPIVNGTPLGSSQLNATAGSPGFATCVYTPGAGTVLPGPGTYTLSTTCTANPVFGSYNPATATVTIQVLSTSTTTTTPALSITWPTPAPIASGIALSFAQLNAFALPTAAAAMCTYNYPLGTVLAPGSYTLTTTCTENPGNVVFAGSYLPATASVTLTVLSVTKATPSITWATPSDIQSGTALSSAQLNATASAGAPLSSSLPGTFAYNPPPGTVLPPGNSQTLSVTFTPSDSTDYNATSASVKINVTAPATISPIGPTAVTVAPNTIIAQYNAFPSVITLNATVTNAAAGSLVGFTLLGGNSNGFANVVNGSASVTFTLPGGTPPGSYPIVAYYYTSFFTTNMAAASGTAQFIVGAPKATVAANNVTAAYSPSDQVITASATVTNGSPSGFVGFTLLGQFSKGTTGVNGPVSVTFTVPGGTAAGSYPIVATYIDPLNSSAVTSSTAQLTVGGSVGASAVTVVPNNVTAAFSPVSSSIQLSATVTNGAIGGSVSFTVLGQTLQSGVTNGSASATFSVPGGTAAGTYPIVASYTGSSGVTASGTAQLIVSGPGAVIVVPNNVTATFSPNLQLIPLSATVTNGQSGGLVTFKLLGGTAQGFVATNGSVAATISIPGGTLAGSYPIVATYNNSLTGATGTGTAQLIIPDACPSTIASPTAVFDFKNATVTLTRLSGPRSQPGASHAVPQAAVGGTAGTFTGTITVTGGQFCTDGTCTSFMMTGNVGGPPDIPPVIPITPIKLTLTGQGGSQSGTAAPPSSPIAACQATTIAGQVLGAALPSGTPAVAGLSTTLQDPITQELFGLEITQRVTLP